jgi:hypothetical protein
MRAQRDVDALMAAAERAGARIVKRAGPTFWGGSAGYFQDPDFVTCGRARAKGTDTRWRHTNWRHRRHHAGR